MKMTDLDIKAQENMAPGVITASGFLGHDERPLVDIISADEETLRYLDMEIYTIVDLLYELLQAAEAGQGSTVTVQDKWLATSNESKGSFPSPWQDGVFHKFDVDVELIEAGHPTGQHLVFNELSIHLLEKHHFLQGKGSPYRLEPEQLKTVLAL